MKKDDLSKFENNEVGFREYLKSKGDSDLEMDLELFKRYLELWLKLKREGNNA